MPDLLSAADVAALLGVSPARVYQMVSCNQLPFTRIAGRIRIPRAAWEEWLKRQTEAALASMEGLTTEGAPHARAK